MKKWFAVNGMGDLRIDFELLYLDYPVLFVLSTRDDIFLVETIDNEEGLFLMAKTTHRKLLKMVSGEVDIRTTMLNTKKILYIKYNYERKGYFPEYTDICDIPEDDLPDVDTYYTLNNEKTRIYRSYLQQRICFEDFKNTRRKRHNNKTILIIDYKAECNDRIKLRKANKIPYKTTKKVYAIKPKVPHYAALRREPNNTCVFTRGNV